MIRFRNSFSFRIYALLLFTMLVGAVMYAGQFYHHRSSVMEETLVKDGRVMARFLAAGARLGVFSASDGLLKGPLTQVAAEHGVLESAVYGLGGELLRREISRKIPKTDKEQKDDAAFRNAVLEQLKREKAERAYDSPHGRDFWAPIVSRGVASDAYMHLDDGRAPMVDEVIGFAVVTMSKRSLAEALAQLRVKSVVVGGLFFVFGMVLSFSVMEMGMGQYRALLRGLSNLERGRLVAIDDLGSEDEMGRVARVYNGLLDDIRRRDAVLEKHEIELDGKEPVAPELPATPLEVTDPVAPAAAAAPEGEVAAGPPRTVTEMEILSGMGDGYFEMDRQRRVTFFSDPFARMAGYSRDTLGGMTEQELASAGCRSRSRVVVDRVEKSREPEILSDYEVVAEDGSCNVLEVNLSAITDGDGEVTGFRGVAREVRLRAGIDREKERQQERFFRYRRLEAISTLAGGIAHDFNNLLMGIQGNASLMLTRIAAGDPNRANLKSIESCVDSGAKLTSHLLGFARGGKYEVSICDLNAILKETAGAFGKTKRKTVSTEETFQEEIWPVEGDRRQLVQVLKDIYENADQAMEREGRVLAHIANVELDQATMAAFSAPSGRYVKITVTDTGVGMDAETRMRVFEPFFTTRTMGRGTGLGMASAYGIIKNHGGIIDLDSEPGKGTTVTIYLPVTSSGTLRKLAPEPMPAPQVPEPVADVPTLLLVDDEEMVILVGCEMLKVMKFNVEIARGGMEALEIYRERGKNIDLVILDMVMPDMGGVETFELLRGIDPDVKTILSSGYSMTGQAEEIMKKGCKGFLQKPYSLQELSDIIDEALGS